VLVMATERLVWETDVAKAAKETGVSPRSRASGAGDVPERRDVYERLADELREDIISGRYKPGDRLPSTLELMERTGVANLTVRGAYRMLIEEGLVESVSKRGFYVRRPNMMTWRMNPGQRRRVGAGSLDNWAADVEATGRAHREEISLAIEDSSVVVLGASVGERLSLPERSRVLVRRAIRYTGPAGESPGDADSLADEYYPYDMVRDTPLASPAPADPVEVLAGIGHRLRSQADELRPRLATTEERRLLSLPQVSVVVELARTAHSTNRVPVAVLHQVRRGDGAIFAYEFSYPGR
jgi:GntR family transcriptional regulator